MFNPFANRAPSLSGPATDALPVTPSDSVSLSEVAVALYIQTGGVLSVVTARGATRTITVADRSLLPLGVRQVRSTGTTASGIHALVIG